MSTIAYYFLQVVLCSGLMMGYYLLVLRNKRFHQYNRFYLLAVAILSWIVPLIKIRWTHYPVTDTAQMLQLLSVVADNNSKIEENINQGFQWSGYTIGAILYVLVAVVLLTALVMALYKVYRLLKHHSCKTVEDVYLILTNEKGTPFSFFRYIFWNEEIDLRSESGKQILQHEIAHVQQKHSVDKILIQAMLVPGWFNPFFWLLKRELEMIHEFIADKRAVNNGDTASLAQMLLTAAFPQQKFALTNPFFFSPIRRRLQMLTNNANPRFSYIRRAIVLPLLAVVVILFSFRSKEKREHLTLSVASVVENVISAVNNDKTDVVNDEPVVTVASVGPIDRTSPSFISDSMATITPVQRPRLTLDDIVISKRDTTIPPKFVTLDIALKDKDGNIIKSYNPDTVVRIRGGTTYRWAAPGNDSPGLKKPLIIVDGVRMEGWWKLDSLNIETVARVDVLKDEESYRKYGDDARNGVVLITTKKSNEYQSLRLVQVTTENRPRTVVGYPTGEQAQFPGGQPAWEKYLTRNIRTDKIKENGAAPGKYTVVVSFVVSETGEISGIRADNDPGYGTKDEAIRLIEKGPKWVPVIKNGKPAGSIRRQSISFIIADEKANAAVIEKVRIDKS